MKARLSLKPSIRCDDAAHPRTSRLGTEPVRGRNTQPSPTSPTTSARGQAAEDRALALLEREGLQLVVRNYRLAGGRSRASGEVDLIMRECDGTLVFVEVRSRAAGSTHGGAAASIGHAKRERLQRAAHHYLMRCRTLPPCRFDVVAIDGQTMQWLPAAFDARPR